MNTIFYPITTTIINACSKNKYEVQTIFAKRSISVRHPISFSCCLIEPTENSEDIYELIGRINEWFQRGFWKTKKDNSWTIHKLEKILAGEILWFCIICWLIKFLVLKDHNWMWNLPEENSKNKTTFSNNERSVFDELIPTNKG